MRRRPRPLAPASAAEVELVDGEVYEDDMIEVDASSSATHFERYRSLIDSFDEDRENWFEKLVRWFFLFMAYSLPLVVAYAMGREIGDAYGGVVQLVGWLVTGHAYGGDGWRVRACHDDALGGDGSAAHDARIAVMRPSSSARVSPSWCSRWPRAWLSGSLPPIISRLMIPVAWSR